MFISPTQLNTRSCDRVLAENSRRGSSVGSGHFGTLRDGLKLNMRPGLRDVRPQKHIGGDAFGNLFAHQGLQLDPEIGSYQNRARQYAPKLKRFMQRDPLGLEPRAGSGYQGGLNSYGCGRQNPSTLFDTPERLIRDPSAASTQPDP